LAAACNQQQLQGLVQEHLVGVTVHWGHIHGRKTGNLKAQKGCGPG